jgi:hypothetical protein
MQKFHADRMATMYHFLKEQVPQKNLQMDAVVSIDGEESPEDLTKHTCESAACVFGYFPLVFPGDYEYRFDFVVARGGRKMPSYQKETAKYFGITWDEADFITDPLSYNDADRDRNGRIKKKDVLDHIKKVMAGYGYTP